MTASAQHQTASDSILAALRILYLPGQVVELRVPKGGPDGTISGFFNRGRDLADAAATLSGAYPGIYTTLNPLRADLLERSPNRLTRNADKGTLASDEDVTERRWMLVDVDPVRPADVSSTEAEREAAFEMAGRVSEFLAQQGWPLPLLADSGNGAHLLFRVQLPNDEPSKALVHGALKRLAQQFNTAALKIDTKVVNASRICKVYGTVAAKGRATDDRPHRAACLLHVPELLVVTPEQLADLQPLPEDGPAKPLTPAPVGDDNARRYVLTALDGAIRTVRAAPAGTRNDTLNSEAYGVFRWAAGGFISTSMVWAGLEDAALANGLEASEVRSTLHSAQDAAAKKPRTLADLPELRHQRQQPSPRPAQPMPDVDMDTGEILTPPKAQLPQPANDNEPPLALCSEDDLAAGHLARMSGDTLWCERWGTWMQWNGDRWTRDETLAVADQVRLSMRIAARQVFHRQEIKQDAQFKMAERMLSARTIANVERIARMDREAATHPDEWDANTWELNTPGGVVDLRTGKLRAHTRADRITKLTAVAPGGDCPTWREFLDTATQGDHELVEFLRRMCGYALTGQIREHALFFVYGTGGNGKGTFLNTITYIMGDYQRVAGAETFTESHGDRHTTELARLQGARLVTAQETEEGKRWAESRIKSLTGGDPITARFMRQDDFTFIPQFKLVIVGNHKPSFRNVDEAIKRRLHLIPFTVNIPPEKRDPKLAEKMRAEAPGILAWMIQGCLEWQQDGLKPPAIVKESTDDYLGAEDSLQQWLDECCEVGPGFASSRALFKSWSEWAEQSGEFVGTTKRLMAKLESRGINIGQKYRGERGCTGIKLKITGF